MLAGTAWVLDLITAGLNLDLVTAVGLWFPCGRRSCWAELCVLRVCRLRWLELWLRGQKHGKLTEFTPRMTSRSWAVRNFRTPPWAWGKHSLRPRMGRSSWVGGPWAGPPWVGGSPNQLD